MTSVPILIKTVIHDIFEKLDGFQSSCTQGIDKRVLKLLKTEILLESLIFTHCMFKSARKLRVRHMYARRHHEQ